MPDGFFESLLQAQEGSDQITIAALILAIFAALIISVLIGIMISLRIKHIELMILSAFIMAKLMKVFFNIFNSKMHIVAQWSRQTENLKGGRA